MTQRNEAAGAEGSATGNGVRPAGSGQTHGAAERSGKVIPPGGTIGVLGGGQLGRMLATAGAQMGYRFVTLDPTPESPCGLVSARQIVAAYDNAEAARELAAESDVITYEFENVDADVAAMLMRESYVPQGSELLRTTQHRLREKRAVEAAGARVAPYREIASEADLAAGVREFGTPSVLKTATGGYDGKGQWVLRSPDEVPAAYEALSRAGTELVLERFIRFEREISVIAARSPKGEVRTFPPAENVHVDNILHVSIVPARIADETAREAERLAVRIAESLGVVGLVAVEMFVAANGELYVNELAPRPHNSGHYSMDACTTSQFEQHIRAVCNLPLAPAKLLTPVVMVNVLGEHVEPLLAWLADDASAAEAAASGVVPKVHLYGKREAKRGRKMGHVNVLAERVADALAWIEKTQIWEERNR